VVVKVKAVILALLRVQAVQVVVLGVLQLSVLVIRLALLQHRALMEEHQTHQETLVVVVGAQAHLVTQELVGRRVLAVLVQPLQLQEHL